MPNTNVTREDKDSLTFLTLNAPETLNCLSEQMLDTLQAHLDNLNDDRKARCIILRSAGKVFCAGHDLQELNQGRQSPDGGRSYFKKIFDKCARLMMTIQRLPQPVIAQVHAHAVAAGCQLVATCDMAVAAEQAWFGVNGVNIGLFCSTPMVALSRNIPRKHAFEMLTSGTMIDARKAYNLGLVNKVAPAENLESATNDLAQLVASKLSAAVKVGKTAFYEQSQLPLEEAYEYAGKIMVENMLFRDTAEGISAFLEKRPPDWE